MSQDLPTDLNFPPINQKSDLEYPDESEQIRHLQYLAYKAQFAEDISKKMRVPDQLTFTETSDINNIKKKRESNTNNEKKIHTEMKVPSKITLHSTFDGGDNLRNPIHEPNVDNNNLTQSVVLKTPPRVLKINDIESYSPENNKKANQTTDIHNGNNLTNLPRDLTQDDLINNEMALHMQDELNDFFNFPDEDALLTQARQQIYSLHRRITSIEKKLEISQKETQINRYCGIAAVVVLGVMILIRGKPDY